MEVNIYIENGIRGARVKEGKAMYLLECEIEGQLYTKNGLTTRKECSKNEIELICLIDALKRMEKSSKIRIFTRNETLFLSMENMWHIQWLKNDWKNAKGKPVKHSELWQQIIELLEIHTWSVTMDEHSYRKWMQNELSKEEE